MKVLNVQPVTASYRIPFFEGLASGPEVSSVVVFSDSSSEFGSYTPRGCRVEHAGWGQIKGIYFPSSFKKYINLLRDSSHVIHFADFKYSTLWFGLIVAKIFGIKFFLHGQGGYKGNQGVAKRLVYFVSVFLSDGYICYTEYSQRNLLRLLPGFLHKKIRVADNTLYLDGTPVFDDFSQDLFYVGRLRDGAGIEIILEVAETLGLVVHVVGEGSSREALECKFKSAVFHGAVFDEGLQRAIAAKCMAGVYGGDAGLSVVHYMSLGLPVVVHSSVRYHMGPEPSYVIDGYNGLLFQRGNMDSLKSVLSRLQCDPVFRKRLSNGAQETFRGLSEPSMHEKFVRIMGL
jgi:glycosyltransferase involved in cell wall biosynthesis